MLNTTTILSKFIVIEGIDGAGTTTQARMLEKKFREKSIPFWATAEPTDSPIGRLIRTILKGELQVESAVTAHLFAADRWEHLYGHGGIRAKIETGYWVLSDRYHFSSLAYQGLLVDPDLVSTLNSSFPLPEYYIFIDVPGEEASRRRALRSTMEIYETDSFQTRVAHRYSQILRELSNTQVKVLSLSGDLPIDKLHDRICSFLPILGT
ncbi:MAG: dTMP kinase [Spirochaetales bacterium]|nr:dTMP kinase [Spirochaetales bacterium]